MAMLDIGSTKQLFIDDYIIESLTNAKQGLNPAVKADHNPILRQERPWEGNVLDVGKVLFDEQDQVFKMWYNTGTVRVRTGVLGEPFMAKDKPIRSGPAWHVLDSEGGFTCFATSEDGIHWERPALGLVEFEGSKENNIIWMGAGCHNFTPVLDTNPNAPADQCYKALASAGPNASLVPFASPDGLTWRRLQEEPVITEGAFDSQNLAFWDGLKGQYVEYHRGFKDGVRDIMTSTSGDFLDWTEPVWLSYGDAPREHLYTNAIFPYARAPHLYIGLPCRFVPGRKKVESHKESGINDGVLMSSRDGLNFERWVEAFIRPGPDALRWTDRNNYPAWGVAETSEEELSVYWTEHYRYPDYRMRRGSIRTDGFVSLHANATGGEALTRPFTYTGGKLVVNYSTSAIGTLMFELCDEEGSAHDGFALGLCEPLFGDELQAEVKWRSEAEPAALAGKTVRLRVRLKDADLYSFRFEG